MITVIYSLDEKAEKRRRRELGLIPLAPEGPTYLSAGDDLIVLFSGDKLSLDSTTVKIAVECVKSFSIVRDQ